MRNPESLILMLEELIRGNFGGIVRAKGVVPIEGQLYRFDVADKRLIRKVTKWRDFCCTKICSRSLFFNGDKA